jgi:hypothetical protein
MIGNYCSGDYYFISATREQADIMALKFAEEHNQKIRNNPNYTIEWDNEEVKEYDIKPGYLPLNRIGLDMEV